MLQLKSSSAAAAGTFNVYEFQADLLRRFTSIRSGDTVEVTADSLRPGFRFSFAPQPAVWIVRPERLTVETTVMNWNCGEQLAEVIKLLPLTITAVGHNFHFEANRESVPNLNDPETFPVSDMPSGYSLDRRAWTVSSRRGEYTFHLRLTDLHDRLEVSANVHIPTENIDAKRQAEYAAQFLPLREETVQLVSEMLCVEAEAL